MKYNKCLFISHLQSQLFGSCPPMLYIHLLWKWMLDVIEKKKVCFAILLCSKRSVPGEEPRQAEKPPGWSRQFLGGDWGAPVTVSRDVPAGTAGGQSSPAWTLCSALHVHSAQLKFCNKLLWGKASESVIANLLLKKIPWKLYRLYFETLLILLETN